MKKIFKVLPLSVLLVACGGGESEDNPLENLDQSSNEAFEEQAATFAEGGAEDGEQYRKRLAVKPVAE